ncbi:glycosyltransferase family 4 protein [Spirosoma endbachense]|uniref:Glycosyltransferase n=1 Tax=Spirosoma endbachense TaxID=2666025 RepID=A0A6P1W7F0_9BACT|nr:glycosyltransferase family 1 protein [Spirosoma endbachense]QHW00499.1 glycosyltransferase [Spirosoma endbachense]
MRIFFDHQTFSLLTYGGIPRYYAELIRGINSTPDNSAYLPLLVSNNIHLRETNIAVRPFFANIRIPKKLQSIYYLNRQYTIYKLNQQPYDVFHATYYDPYFLPYLKKRPFVVTFLDMIHEKFGTQFSELAYNGVITEQKRLLANRADRIIAISESTKNDIVELLNIAPSKIDVIYLGSSLSPEPLKPSSRISEPSFLLFVGNRSMYKNFIFFLKAIHPVLKKYKIKLLCAGGGEFTKAERALIQSLNADLLVEQCSINDQTLPILYQKALAFIFPTLYEGFGIPVLEAFACDCPCVVSNVSSLPEVAGDAALYIDPTMSDSIIYAVERLVNDSNLRETLIQKGRKQLTKFSWQHTVAETLSLYKNIS